MWGRILHPFRAEVQESAGLAITKNTEFPGANATVEIVDRESGAGGRSDFTRKRTAVKELRHMYQGSADWGNQLVKNITNYRIGMVFPKGIKADLLDKPKEGREEHAAGSASSGAGELAFIQDKVIRFNKLDGPGATKIALMGELEGQAAVYLRAVLDTDGNLVGIAADRIPWAATEYTVAWRTIPGLDGLQPESAGLDHIAYTVDDVTQVVLDGDRAVFVAFDALDDGKVGRPTCMGLITELIDVDKALADLREGNQYFAKPSPTFQVNSPEEAARLNAILTGESKRNLKLTHWKVIHGRFELVGMDLSGTEALLREIETKIKIISGGTGVPVQHLGFPEFMSNRATADNTMEPVANFASTEQEIWSTFYQEVFDKAIALANAVNAPNQRKLEQGRVVPVLSTTTQRDLSILRDIKLPMAERGQYPWSTVRREVPSIDSPEELEAALAGEHAPPERPERQGLFLDDVIVDAA